MAGLGGLGVVDFSKVWMPEPVWEDYGRGVEDWYVQDFDDQYHETIQLEQLDYDWWDPWE